MMTPREILNISPVIPVVAIDDANKAVELSNALLEGGINIIEVTLRTPDALKAMELISKNVPDMILGGGTVLNGEQLDSIINVGCKFAISPGFSKSLLEYAPKKDIPLIPGVGSASEIMGAMEYGYDAFKLFPANVVGGIDALKAFEGPFKDVVFCPTGGVKPDNLSQYLELKNVACVGGTWITSKGLINTNSFRQITANCKEALNNIHNLKIE